ncbi:hypothetical protein [Streptomyces yangpuensis]|uniref:hypothetical protein n=1 Tax=Streptomyces yangpuensis TaxID=1648182 RepID=UPI00371BE380
MAVQAPEEVVVVGDRAGCHADGAAAREVVHPPVEVELVQQAAVTARQVVHAADREAKQAALACFASQQQLDMEVFSGLTALAYRQHVHHRVVERFPEDAHGAEMFRTARQIVHASWQAVTGLPAIPEAVLAR